MRRRDFTTLLGVALAWPLAVPAQQAGRKGRIGVIIPANPEPYFSQVREGLRRLGYIEGGNLEIEFRSADGNPDLLPKLAADLVRLKVDVIIASQTPAVQAAKQATKEIPIVMATAGDPVGTGLVASLARPGGNVTGLSGTTAALGGKILELIREMRPSAKKVAVLANATDPFTKSFLEQIQLAGRAMAIETPVLLVREAAEFATAFSEMDKRRVDAVIVQPSLTRKAAVDLSLKHRLPAVSPNALFPEAGGLLSYAASVAHAQREAAVYVDKILKGARPADLPVQQPSNFDLIVNLRTAKAIGLKIPKSILVRADRIIE